MKEFFTFFLFCAVILPTYSIDVHGHRGARARRPENTLAAFRHALLAGAHVLEMDLLVSKDGVLVVHHDPRINLNLCKNEKKEMTFTGSPSTGPAIIDLSLAEIKSYDCGSRKNPKFPEQTLFPGERIPTFDEVVALVNSEAPIPGNVRWNIEMKSKAKEPDYSPKPQKFAQMVYETITRHQIQSRTIVQSFDYRTLKAMRAIDPKIRVSALVSKKSPNPYLVLKRLKPDILSVRWDLLTKKLVMIAHSQETEVVPWTVNSKDGWKKMLKLGVDGIITDDPQALVHYLDQVFSKRSKAITPLDLRRPKSVD